MDVKRLLRGMMAFAIAASVVAPAGATTLIRESLDELVRSNRTIVVGEVVDARSYWNSDGTFILTDVRIAAHYSYADARAEHGDFRSQCARRTTHRHADRADRRRVDAGTGANCNC